jgi:methionyl-tRNA synthetase
VINIEEFQKVEMRVGRIVSVEKVPETDKLLKLSVDFGMKPPSPDDSSAEKDIRQIISGIALYFPDPHNLVEKKCVFVTNLEPRTIKGLESRGMIMAVSSDEGEFSLLEVSPDIPPGTKVK